MMSLRPQKWAQKRAERNSSKFGEDTHIELKVQLTRFDAATRAEAIRLDHEGAATNSDFLSLVTAADAARDARDWGRAEFLYARALEIYPFHSGYRIQYAHVTKEQGKYDWAEVHYRSALAEGAAAGLVNEHLRFCALQNQFNYVQQLPIFLEVSPFYAPPTVDDITTLAWLFLDDSKLNSYDTLNLLRECKSNSDVVLHLLECDRFVKCNRRFLEMLRK